MTRRYVTTSPLIAPLLRRAVVLRAETIAFQRRESEANGETAGPERAQITDAIARFQANGGIIRRIPYQGDALPDDPPSKLVGKPDMPEFISLEEAKL